MLPEFQRLFRGRETAFGQSSGKGEKKRAFTVKGEPQQEHWENHLSGNQFGLGIPPLRLDNQCYFGAIDLDDDEVDHASLDTRVSDLGLPLVVCRSRSGGAHLFLFCREPVPAELLIQKLAECAEALELKNPPDNKGNVRPVEIFPKQAKAKKDEVGNWINLPYFNKDQTERYCVHDGEQLSFEEFIMFAQSMAVTLSELSILKPGGLFADAPPCLQTLNRIGYPTGTRNQGLYNVGVFLKLAFPEDWKDRLHQYNLERMDPPMRKNEVEGVIRSLDGKDYTFKCSDLPISSHCQKQVCKKRKFGITAFRRNAINALFPALSGLVKVLTDPPIWYLDINDQTIQLSTEDLMQIVRFKKVVFERLNILIPSIKQTEWEDRIRDLLDDLEIQEAPSDAGVLGVFNSLLSEFLQLRRKSETKADLLLGKPYEENGRVYFRGQDLKDHLDRKRFRDYAQHEVYAALRMIGAGHSQFSINGATVQVWWLPVPSGEQTEEFALPVSTNEPEF